MPHYYNRQINKTEELNSLHQTPRIGNMIEFFDLRTFILVNMLMSLTFSFIILLIKIHFPHQLKGTIPWFFSLFLPAVSFSFFFLIHPGPEQPLLIQLIPPILTGITFFMGNLFFYIGWKRFFNDRLLSCYYVFFILLTIFILLSILPFTGNRKILIPTHFISSIFNLIIFVWVVFYLIIKTKEQHDYTSLAILILNILALITTVIPIIYYIRKDFHIFPTQVGLIQSISNMFRNSFVLFSIYVAVMHQFKVDHQLILDEKNRLMKELEILSVTDELTGLYNRRGFDNYIDYEYTQSKRDNPGYTITLGDIDFFKKVNDTYGHDCGDHVIKLISRTLKENIREQDCLARWGGEEFIILQKGNNAESTKQIIERIRRQIEDLKIHYDDHTFSITMSFGIAEMNPSYENYDKFIIDADMKLYQAKQSGRNRIVI